MQMALAVVRADRRLTFEGRIPIVGTEFSSRKVIQVEEALYQPPLATAKAISVSHTSKAWTRL